MSTPYSILASGSSGNCIIINDIIALDMGIPFKLLGEYAKTIKLVFISHQHSDHFNPATIKRLHDLRPTVRFCVGDFLYQKLIDIGINKKNIDVIKHNKIYDYRILKIMPFILIHDVKNYGLKIVDLKAKQKIIYAVDTNRIDYVEARNYDLYLIEANYDEDKLAENIKRDMEQGIYSYGMRVKDTHLSIQKASDWIMKNAGAASEYEFIHQSKNNL